MKHIKVSSNVVVGQPFTLAKNYVAPDGSTVTNVASLSVAEKVAVGLYPFVDVAHAEWETDVTYTVNAENVTASYVAIPLADYKQQALAKVYEQKNAELDKLVEGYSQLEVATWPAIQADVAQYGVDGTVGVAMQQAIDTSGYDAAGLAALLVPRINQQATILAERKAMATAIMAAGTHAEV